LLLFFKKEDLPFLPWRRRAFQPVVNRLTQPTRRHRHRGNAQLIAAQAMLTARRVDARSTGRFTRSNLSHVGLGDAGA